ncbi:MAG: DUF3597 domain-containing protein [Pseudobdellovibrionaceae bacterium]
MNIFSAIMDKVFSGKNAAAANPQPPAPGAAPKTAVPASSHAPVDVNAILSKMAANKGEKLNWQTSIVDLLKLLDMDSSLAARKQLAQELHYTGDMNDSAKMNIWLQKEVMRKFAENGGKLTPELLH